MTTVLRIRQYARSEGQSVGEEIGLVLENLESFERVTVTDKQGNSYEAVSIRTVSGREFLADEKAVDFLSALLSSPDSNVLTIGSSA